MCISSIPDSHPLFLPKDVDMRFEQSLVIVLHITNTTLLHYAYSSLAT